jgi:hypothetical protein
MFRALKLLDIEVDDFMGYFFESRKSAENKTLSLSERDIHTKFMIDWARYIKGDLLTLAALRDQLRRLQDSYAPPPTKKVLRDASGDSS